MMTLPQTSRMPMTNNSRRHSTLPLKITTVSKNKNSTNLLLCLSVSTCGRDSRKKMMSLPICRRSSKKSKSQRSYPLKSNKNQSISQSLTLEGLKTPMPKSLQKTLMTHSPKSLQKMPMTPFQKNKSQCSNQRRR